MSLVLASYAIPARAQEAYPPTYYAQPQPVQQLSDNTMAPTYAPQPAYAPVAQPQPAAQPAQNPDHSGEYGSSIVTDLRQLNF